jgi:hypothetical protein
VDNLATMLLIIPILNLVILLRLAQRRMEGIREASLIAGAWWTLELVALTEGLSAFRGITEFWLAMGWFLMTLGLAAVLLRWKAAHASVPPRKSSMDGRILSRGDYWALAGAAIICVLVGITALVSAPNGSDQLQYHLPRMIQWADRHSIRFFPTNYYVQLFAPPLAEWNMLHTYVLTGGDRFVSMAQWLAFVGSAVAVSLIAKELGAAVRGQVLAAVLCVTLPQGILAASGAKNDWVLSLWMAAATYFLLRFCWDRSWLNTANLGIALGAALLSKGTVYAFLPGILLGILILVYCSDRKSIVSRIPVVVAMVLLMNGSQWARNYTLGGSIFGLPYPDVAGTEKYTVDRVTISGAVSNTVRELFMHLGTPSEKFNGFETRAVRTFVSRLGVDPDDPALTNFSKFRIPHYDREEYYAGNPLHLLLAIFAFAVVFVTYRQSGLGKVLLLRTSRKTDTVSSAPPKGLASSFAVRWRASAPFALSIGIIGGFVLYCSLFKWEVWCARLHLPLFVLACAVIAVVIEERFRRLALPLVGLLLIMALPPTLSNETRPLLFSGRFGHLNRNEESILVRSRPELYFSEQGSLESSYAPAAAAVRDEHCATVGLDTSVLIYAHEYPLMAMGRNPGEASTFRYVDVHNLSSKYADDFDRVQPCVVICPNCREHKEKWAEYSGSLPRTRVFGNLVVFGKALEAASR